MLIQKFKAQSTPVKLLIVAAIVALVAGIGYALYRWLSHEAAERDDDDCPCGCGGTCKEAETETVVAEEQITDDRQEADEDDSSIRTAAARFDPTPNIRVAVRRMNQRLESLNRALASPSASFDPRQNGARQRPHRRVHVEGQICAAQR